MGSHSVKILVYVEARFYATSLSNPKITKRNKKNKNNRTLETKIKIRVLKHEQNEII